jgi:hypothetical protein
MCNIQHLSTMQCKCLFKDTSKLMNNQEVNYYSALVVDLALNN